MKILYLIGYIFSSQLLYSESNIIGGGNNYCAYLINTVKQHKQYAGMWKQWITGLVSGYNLAINKNILKKISDDSIYYAVKDRCTSNPKEKVYQAVKWVIENQE